MTMNRLDVIYLRCFKLEMALLSSYNGTPDIISETRGDVTNGVWT